MALKKDEATKKWFYYGKYKDPLTGKTKNYKKRGFKTKAEAKVAEAVFLQELNNQISGNIKMSDLIDEYFKQQKKVLKTSSYNSTHNRVVLHILPYFENIGIKDITPKTIQEWKDTINNKGLSLRYKRDIYTVFSGIFAFAEKYYNVDNNSLRIEGNFRDPNVKKKEIEFWTLEEFKQFDSVIDDLEYKTLYNFLYWTGCRRGEALSLNWNDFTPGFKAVKISKTINQKITGQSYQITPPKSSTSNRVIPLPKQLISLLERLYEEDEQIDGFTNDCFVFGVEKPLSDTTVERKKNKYCEIAHVKKITIHSFRHSHASYLINNMPNDSNLILAISKRLGHSSPTITLEIYAHMMPDDNKKILDLLNQE